MGGEWNFLGPTLKPSQVYPEGLPHNKKPLDVKEYRDLLIRLKRKYEKKFKPQHVRWCDVHDLPPVDNIFARFKFKCNRHKYDGPDHPWFNLYWDPLPQDYHMYGSLHDWCSGMYRGDVLDFNHWALFDIQREIVEKFPDHFVLYREFTDSAEYDSTKPGGLRYYDSD